MSKPIKPSDVVEQKGKDIPDFVLESFNDAIAKNYKNRLSRVTLKEVVKIILLKMPKNYRKKDIFLNGWLDVEEIYKSSGWEVKYRQPPYCESHFDPYFEFIH